MFGSKICKRITKPAVFLLAVVFLFTFAPVEAAVDGTPVTYDLNEALFALAIAGDAYKSPKEMELNTELYDASVFYRNAWRESYRKFGYTPVCEIYDGYSYPYLV